MGFYLFKDNLKYTMVLKASCCDGFRCSSLEIMLKNIGMLINGVGGTNNYLILLEFDHLRTN
jgi:hypothetical protein